MTNATDETTQSEMLFTGINEYNGIILTCVRNAYMYTYTYIVKITLGEYLKNRKFGNQEKEYVKNSLMYFGPLSVLHKKEETSLKNYSL